MDGLDRKTLNEMYSQFNTETLKRLESTIKGILYIRSKTDRTPIAYADISIRSRGICKSMNILYVDELAAFKRIDIAQNRNIRMRSLREFDILLKQHNLKWSDDET